MDIKYKLVPHQKKFFTSDKPFVVLNCGRSSGKSFIASLIAALRVKEGHKILVWAQNFSALSENLMKEIVCRLDEMNIKYSYVQGGKQKITVGKGVIYGLSYENIESCRGFTEVSIAICDEIALAPADFLGTMSFCMRGKGIKPKIYAMTTPRMNSWWNTFVKKADPAKIDIIHGTMKPLLDKEIITQDTVDLVKSTCVNELLYRQEMLGELVEDSGDGVLFTSKLLSECSGYAHKNNDGYCIGIDCAGLGNDSNVILVRNQCEILEIIEKQVMSNAELCSTVLGIIMKYDRRKLSHICIDEAFGIDLNERLRNAGVNSTLVAFGGKAKNDAYANNRAEMYIKCKKELEETGLKGLTEELENELRATRYVLTNSNKLQIIPKADIKTNIGRSPDLADALALSYYLPIIPEEIIKGNRLRQNRFMR